MNKATIERAAGEYSGSILGFKDNPAVMARHKAFSDGAHYVLDLICHGRTWEDALNELAEYAEETGKDRKEVQK